jgi:hypothetical protein
VRDFWRRLPAAVLAAYVAGYAVEAVLGNWDPRQVGWSASFLPVLAEGAVFGFMLGGLWGAVLAPLPLLVVPETWVRAVTLLDRVGPWGLLILVQPLPAMWAAGGAGAAAGWALRRLRAQR